MSDQKEAKKSRSANTLSLMNSNHLYRFSLVISTTLVIVLSLVFVGYWLDKKFDTKPWLLITFLILSFPLSQLAVYKKMKQFVNRERQKIDIKSK